MSGHSKWAKIKHKKAVTDSKRQAAFSRMLKEITSVAKDSGGNPDTNPRLRTAIFRAKSLSIPMSTVENAIKKGTGELPGVVYENTMFDVRGPKGVALLVECLTDNKNRTTAEVRAILNRNNGKMGEPGSTIRLFDKKGLIEIEKDKISEEALTELILEAGAEDLSAEEEMYEVTCEPSSLEAVRIALEQKKIPVQNAEIIMIAREPIPVDGKDAQQILDLIEALEESEDVQNVHANCDIAAPDPEAVE